MSNIDFDPRVDHYKVLGVDSKATADEIKKAYRRLAKANHPDSTGGDKAKETRFKSVGNAYDVLSDPRKRATYDQIRAGGAPQAGAGVGGAAGQAGVWDLGDLFGQIFNGGRTGGRVRVDRFDLGGEEATPFARGPGAPRRPAGADEFQDADFESRVKASDGSWLAVGDGGDVHSDVRISFERAILGTVAEVPTIDGKAQVKVPPGTSSGKKLRLRGKGLGSASGTGDHYVTVHIDVPGDLDEDARKLLVELTQKLGHQPKAKKTRS